MKRKFACAPRRRRSLLCTAAALAASLGLVSVSAAAQAQYNQYNQVNTYNNAYNPYNRSRPAPSTGPMGSSAPAYPSYQNASPGYYSSGYGSNYYGPSGYYPSGYGSYHYGSPGYYPSGYRAPYSNAPGYYPSGSPSPYANAPGNESNFRGPGIFGDPYGQRFGTDSRGIFPSPGYSTFEPRPGIGMTQAETLSNQGYQGYIDRSRPYGILPQRNNIPDYPFAPNRISPQQNEVGNYPIASSVPRQPLHDDVGNYPIPSSVRPQPLHDDVGNYPISPNHIHVSGNILPEGFNPGGPSNPHFHSPAGFGYPYHNGIFGRDHPNLYPVWGSLYFPDASAYFPDYYLTAVAGVTCPSLYSAYYGVFPPYIAQGAVIVTAPTYVYVPVPVYVDGSYQGWQGDDLDGYYLNRDQSQDYRLGDGAPQNEPGQDANKPSTGSTGSPANSQSGPGNNTGQQPQIDPLVQKAVGDIQQAWQNGDIQVLSKHISPDSKIAVYLRGKYQYSLDSADYLDMTRDALRSTNTVRFELDSARKKENGVYTVTGRHVYKGKDGAEHTVYVSYVLEKKDGDYIITQVGTAPDKL